MLYDIPQNFYELLTEKFNQAFENGHVKFNGESATNEIIHSKVNDTTIDFQLTLLRSLMHRPENGTKETNPFAKPEPELMIVDNFGPDREFRIIFNKYPVIPKHFMLVTKEFKPQESPLSTNELVGTFTILKKLKDSGKDEKWFAFYNCGLEGGASQPHKHIQFMTFPNEDFVPYPERLANGSSPFIPNDKQEPLQDPHIPFAHFVCRLPESTDDLTEDDLTMSFASLLQRSLTVSRENGADHISYNFIVTTKYMMMIPRSKGKYKDLLGINSCGVVGLVLCKDEELLDLVKQDGPEAILKGCGFPNTAGDPTSEYHY